MNLTLGTILALLEMAERLVALAGRIKAQNGVANEDLLAAAEQQDRATLVRTQAWIDKLRS